MWLFIWLALAPNGSLTSGTIEFPTQEACEAGKKSWGTLLLVEVEKGGNTPAMQF